MRLRLIYLPLLVLTMLVACGDDDDDEGGEAEGGGETVTVVNAMEPEEATALQEVVDELITADTDYTVEIQANAEFEEQTQIAVEGGNPPSIAMYPGPGAVQEWAESGDAIALEDLGFDAAELEETFGEHLMSLGEFEGKHYGLPTNINLKSMVWYPKDDFDAAGYEVPTTFDELIALSDQIVADGSTPWCVGLESGGATGWPATDWMEDIMLNTAGVDVYDQWASHEIPFDHPAVVAAGETFGQVMFTEGYVLGGAEQTPSIAFADAPAPMFEDPPGCWLHRQATFINSFFPEDAEAGVDYDWFPFPEIDQQNTLFGGELSVVFEDNPAVRDFLEKFADVEVQCAQGGDVRMSRVSPNVGVGADCYANDILADASEILVEALETGNGRFDAADLLPTASQTAFFTAMVEYVQGGPDSLEGVLADVEASFP